MPDDVPMRPDRLALQAGRWLTQVAPNIPCLTVSLEQARLGAGSAVVDRAVAEVPREVRRVSRLLLWLTATVLGAAIGLGTGFFPLLILAALPVVALVVLSDAKRVGLSGLLLGFGGIWFLMISRVRELCARGEASSCYSSVEDAWFNAALVSLIVAAVLLLWAAGSHLASQRRVGPELP